MANTSHSLDLEKQEQDEILANLNALTATVGNNTTSISNISLTPINNKFRLLSPNAKAGDIAKLIKISLNKLALVLVFSIN